MVWILKGFNLGLEARRGFASQVGDGVSRMNQRLPFDRNRRQLV